MGNPISVDFYSDEDPPRLCICGISSARVDQLRRILVENRDGSGVAAASFWCAVLDQIEDQLDQYASQRKQRIRRAFDEVSESGLTDEQMAKAVSKRVGGSPISFCEIEQIIVTDFKSGMAQL